MLCLIPHEEAQPPGLNRNASLPGVHNCIIGWQMNDCCVCSQGVQGLTAIMRPGADSQHAAASTREQPLPYCSCINPAMGHNPPLTAPQPQAALLLPCYRMNAAHDCSFLVHAPCSLVVRSPPLPIGMYAVSKTALLGLVKGLAAELGPSHGIRGAPASSARILSCMPVPSHLCTRTRALLCMTCWCPHVGAQGNLHFCA